MGITVASPICTPLILTSGRVVGIRNCEITPFCLRGCNTVNGRKA
jgi:hypothetical protein